MTLDVGMRRIPMRSWSGFRRRLRTFERFTTRGNP